MGCENEWGSSASTLYVGGKWPRGGDGRDAILRERLSAGSYSRSVCVATLGPSATHLLSVRGVSGTPFAPKLIRMHPSYPY